MRRGIVLLVFIIFAAVVGSAQLFGSSNETERFAFGQMTQSKSEAHHSLIVILGGSEGGLWKRRGFARELADSGFSNVQLAYFDFPGGPKHLKKIAIEDVVEGIRAAAKQADVDEACVSVLGVSKGAELSLLIASYRDVAANYVSIVPSNVVWQSSSPSLIAQSSWTLNSEPLPFIRYVWFSRATIRALNNVEVSRPLHDLSLKRAKAIEAARIPVKNIADPLFY